MVSKPDQIVFEDKIFVNYLLPWRQKRLIKAAQKAAGDGKIRVKASIRGLYVRGEHQELAMAGLTRHYTQDTKMAALVRTARARTKIKASEWFRHPSGEITAAINIEGNAREAIELGKSLIGERKASQVVVYDNRGWPYKTQRIQGNLDVQNSTNSSCNYE